MRRGLLGVGAVAMLLGVGACDDSAGPGAAFGHLAFVPAFASRFVGIVDVNRARVTLRRIRDATLVLDTTVNVTSDSVDLTFTVPVVSTSEQFELLLRLITAAGDTVFRAGPDTVTASRGGVDDGRGVTVPLTYTGVGANAARVEIQEQAPVVFVGGTLPLTAIAYDDANNPIPNTPVAWRSLDPTVATVPDDAQGTVAGVAVGTARIVAELLTGPADTVTLGVVDRPVGQKLVFTLQPMTTTQGVTLPQVAVTVLDGQDQPVTDDNATQVTLGLTRAASAPGTQLSGILTKTVVNGIATFTGLSIDQYGSNYQLTATGSGLTAGVSQAFMITPAGMTRLWTGASDIDWTNGGNWAAGTAPGTTDNVFIPAAATRQPVVMFDIFLRDLIVETGGRLDLQSDVPTVHTTGKVDAGYTSITSGTGGIVKMENTALATVRGSFPGLIIAGPVRLADDIIVNDALTVDGFTSPANLDLNGHAATVNFAFYAQNGGTLTMKNPADVLDVAGMAWFDGGDQTGLLTDGVIYVGGDFYAGTLSTAFVASGNHRVVFNGSGPQMADFDSPGPPPPGVGQHFWDLEATNGAVLTPGSTTGQYYVGRDFTVSGNADAQLGAVSLTNFVQVDRNFVTTESGTLTMNDFGAPTQLDVLGDASFGGGSTDARLTGGFLKVHGNFAQQAATSTESFHAGGTHTVDFVGTGAQTVFFETPGIGVGNPVSHFAHVAFNNTGTGVTLAGPVFAHSNLESTTGAQPAIVYGNGNQLAVGGLDASDLVLDNVYLQWNGTTGFPSLGSFVRFDLVTFQNYDPVGIPFVIIHPDASVSMTDLTFTVTPNIGSGGRYMSAEDEDGGTPLLSIDVTAFVPGGTCVGTEFEQVSNAMINATCQ